MPALAPARPALRAQVYVDASAPAGGDGSATRPWKTLPPRLPARTDVHVLTGLYRGPFLLDDDAHLEGQGEVVLHAEPGQVVLTLGRGSAAGVSLQGGDVGLLALGEGRVERLRLSGQRVAAARVQGDLTAAELDVVGVVEDADGLVVTGSLALEASRFTGGLRRALRLLEGARATLGKLTSEGPKTFLHALAARVDLREAHASQGAGPAIFLSGGEATLEGVDVRGHEYGLQLASGARATLTHFTSGGALEAAISSYGSTLTLRRSTLGGSGTGGALFAQQSTVRAEDLVVRDARHLALLLRQSTVHLERCRIERVSHDGDALGDGVMARDSRVEIVDLRVSDVEGSALFAGAAAVVSITGLQVDRAHRSALFVERGSRLTADAVLVRGGSGPAVLVPDAATVSIGTLSVAGGEVPIYAECDQGAQVFLGRLEATLPQPESRCIHFSGGAP